MKNKSQSEFIDDEDFYFYAKDLEQEWIKSKETFTTKELLTIFPEAKQIIPQKIAEYKEERKALIENMKSIYQKVKEIKGKDDFFYYFWGYQYVKYFFAPTIIKIDKHLSRLYRQYKTFNTHATTKRQSDNWDELIEKARNFPLYELASMYLKKSKTVGNRITSLCPFHKETTPSFNIYINNNSFHCFGCSAHGDVIDFLMEIENLNFKGAVKELTR